MQTRKVAINTEIGGFKLSPKAVLWLYERGYDAPHFKYPVDVEDLLIRQDLEEWKHYLRTDLKQPCFLMSVFTSDERYILNQFPLDEERSHPLLIECIETLKEEAGEAIRVIEIPFDVDYYIAESDCGIEWVAEKHRTWGRE